MPPDLDIAPEVRTALDTSKAVVALESTIVAHGMPYPENLEVARSLEAIVRAGGAIPATIAILDGRIRVGLTDPELRRIAEDTAVSKASSRDLAVILAKGMCGATTVAATVRIAAMAGISVFATGGIGGVHRGADRSFDVSADLMEIAANDVTVVSAGAKAILDLPATLEYLETLSVPVISFGVDDFPAFYSRSSGLKAPHRCDTVEEIAAVWRQRKAIGQRGGLIIANPIPAEHEIPVNEMAAHIDEAIFTASTLGIGGKAVTPFLLARLAERTAGRSQVANTALVRNNAKLAAALAVAIACQP